MIVAAEVTQDANDKHQLAAMLEQVQQNVGDKPQAASVDTGYWDPKQVSDPRVQGIDLYVAVGKQKHGERNAAVKEDPDAVELADLDSLLEQMKQKLKTEVQDGICTACARRLWNRYSGRSRSSVGCGGFSYADCRTCERNGS